MDELAEGFKALADPTRLRLLNLLRHGELCVCDLMEALEIPQSKVSRHLSYLKKEGWVSGRRSGKWMHYELALPRHPLLVKVMEALQQSLGSHEMAIRDETRLRRYLKTKASNHCG
uniref:Putative transcriptional regulator n=1 Tax=Desulfovibrio sp. U5L TaxID=596152 RepID=I2Q6Y3_9BACT